MKNTQTRLTLIQAYARYYLGKTADLFFLGDHGSLIDVNEAWAFLHNQFPNQTNILRKMQSQELHRELKSLRAFLEVLL
jgi:hypothetical protein